MNLANASEFRVAEVSSILDRKHNRQSVNAIDQFAIDDNNSRQKEKKNLFKNLLLKRIFITSLSFDRD